MLDYNLFAPIRNFGVILLIVGIAGLFCFAAFFNDPEFYILMKIFTFMVSAFHIFMGYNIVSRNRYGFKCLKFCLYLLSLSFPVGSFYAKKAFEYIEDNNIEKFFGKSLIIFIF